MSATSTTGVSTPKNGRKGGMEPTLSYQEPDTDPRHVKAVEPSLDVESDPLSLMALLPLEHALRDGCHCGVMTPLDGVERPGETSVVLVDLWRPLCFRSRHCVIPATVKDRERSSAILFFTRSDITDRFSIGIRSLHRLVPFPSPLALYLFSLKDGFGVETGREMSPWFNALRISGEREMGGKLISS